jgi:hypothetical protein
MPTSMDVCPYQCTRGGFPVNDLTVFEGKHFRPAQTILLLRGVCKGEPTAAIAREIGVTRQTVHDR